MIPFFFRRQPSPNNEIWRYVLVLLLVVTGIIGFGGLALRFAFYAKGVSDQEIQTLTDEDYNNYFTPNEILSYNLFAFLVVFIMLILGVRFIFRARPIVLFTNRPKIDFKRFFTAFLLWGIVNGLLIGIDLTINGAANLQWNYKPETFFMLLAICVFLVPIQTGAEELFCRGLVLKWTGKVIGSGLIVALINGIVFGSLHLGNPEIGKLGYFALVFYVLSGVFASVLTILDDGIELSWGYHTMNNFIGLMLISTDWQALPTEALWIDKTKPDVGWGYIVILAVCYPLMIFILSKIYRWTGWRERLLGRKKEDFPTEKTDSHL